MFKSVLDCHCHTIASGHAYSTVTEYAAQASKIGLKIIAITDHAPQTMGMAFGEIYFLNLKAIPQYICDVEVLKGVELNILNKDGDIDLPEYLLKRLDIVIASLHDICIKPSTVEDNTKAVINAIKNKYIRIIGHIGDPSFPVNTEEIVKAAKDYSVAIEMNEASFIGYRSAGTNVIIKLAEQCKKHNTSMIWGSDSHFHTAIGQFENCQKTSQLVGLEEKDILNTDVHLFKNFFGLQ